MWSLIRCEGKYSLGCVCTRPRAPRPRRRPSFGTLLRRTQVAADGRGGVRMSEDTYVSNRKRNRGLAVDYIMDPIQKRQFLDSRLLPFALSLAPHSFLLNLHSPLSLEEPPSFFFSFVSSLLILCLGIPSHVFQPLLAGLRACLHCCRAEPWFDC